MLKLEKIIAIKKLLQAAGLSNSEINFVGVDYHDEEFLEELLAEDGKEFESYLKAISQALGEKLLYHIKGDSLA